MFVLAALPCTAQAQDGDYPVREVLDAFATACSGAENTSVNLASAEAAGWEKLPANSDTPIGRLVRQGLEAMAAQDAAAGETPAVPLEGGEFRKVVAGRTLYLAVSQVQIDEMIARGCRVYDFDAPRGLTADELQSWAVRAPNDRQSRPDGVTRATFNPGLKPGHMEMEVYFVPPGTEALPGIPLSGIGLIAGTLEF